MKRNSIVLFIAFLVMACGNGKSINSHEPQQTSENDLFIEAEKIEELAEIASTNSTSVDSTENLLQEIYAANSQSIEAFNHEAFNELLIAYVSEAGVVNYKGFIQNKKLLEGYISSLSESLPTDTWTKEDKLAYWMNAYNAMTIDLIIRNYPIKSIKDLKKPWDQRLWKLGDAWYNLNEIEHQILRKMNEPRIHFGINCASFSCPPLLNEAFSASEVDAQLNKIAIRFINDPQRNSIAKMNVEISEIFSWFAKDFKQDGSLFEFLNTYATVKIHPKARKKYKKYDWTLNE